MCRPCRRSRISQRAVAEVRGSGALRLSLAPQSHLIQFTKDQPTTVSMLRATQSERDPFRRRAVWQQLAIAHEVAIRDKGELA